MRRVTRNFLLGVLAVVVLLLALGALPGLLKSGAPYYASAEVTTAAAAVNATDLPERRYPYTSAAMANATPEADGRSAPYWRGPVGLKGAFTHSPFDELDALRARNPDATDGPAVFVRRDGTVYRVLVFREGTP
jgi:hypothetical protein